jgi:hypothetical protein
MTIDLDLIHDFMASEEVPAGDLALARSILVTAIGVEIQENDASSTLSDVSPRGHRHSGRRIPWSVGLAAAAVAVACALLISQVVPSHSKPGRSITAAAQISRLADFVQPPPPLQAGQWSDYQMHGIVAASVSEVGKTPTPDAQAAIPILLEVWSNSTGTTCTSEQFGTATFASAENAQAWHAIGLIDSPMNQPVTDCRADLLGSSNGSTLAAIDVSHITHDPSALAAQLQGGTTGVQTVDQDATNYDYPASLAGFIRLTVLLVGPVSGSWSGFGQEMLRTMALLPGVVSLGPITAHSGQTGPAFSVSKEAASGQQTGIVVPTVVLDAGTGALLEARDFSIPVLQAAAQDFVGSPSAPVYAEGVSYGVSTEWIDPAAPPGIIGQDALPGWISTFHVIQAVTKATTNDAELSRTFSPFLGNGDYAYSVSKGPGVGQIIWDVVVRGTVADEDAVVAALNASELFEDVTVKA